MIRRIQLARPSDVQQAIKGLEVFKVPGPNGIPSRVLTLLARWAITFLSKV
jgi:hypothetical protein